MSLFSPLIACSYVWRVDGGDRLYSRVVASTLSDSLSSVRGGLLCKLPLSLQSL